MKTRMVNQPRAFQTDLERQRILLIERYMRLNGNFSYNSSSEEYPWLKDSNKNRYNSAVNVNNWLDERHDVKYIKSRRQILSDFDHTYKTEYNTSFGESKKIRSIPVSKIGNAFPGHQPELDLPLLKKVYNTYETTSRAAFQDPRSIVTRPPEIQCKYCRLYMERVQS